MIQNCPLCRGSKLHLHISAKRSGTDRRPSEYACSSMGHGDHNDIYFCEDCRHGFLSPIPTAEELDELYSNVVDESYLSEQEGRIRTFSHNLELLRPYRRGKHLLEIGSYCGTFRHLAEKEGYDTTGVEPSIWAVEQAKNLYQLSTINNPFNFKLIDSGLLPQHLFEHIVAWDVLEHIEHPVEFLKLCHSLQPEKGIVAISTVNIDSLFTRIMGKKWPWYMQMHLHYFTRDSLNLCFAQAGYRVLEIGTYRHVISARYLLKKIASLTGLPLQKLGKIGGLNKLFIPFGLGDIVYVIAEKIG